MSATLVTFMLNGTETDAVVRGLTTLQAVLREQLDRTGTKAGCRQGSCGSCTVLLDGEPVLSCLLPAADVDGHAVITVEGLAQPPAPGSSEPRLSPLQEAFLEHYAAQCGFCTPGMLMTSTALLEQRPQPRREEVAAALCGNVCRCTGYTAILDAVEAASHPTTAPPGAGAATTSPRSHPTATPTANPTAADARADLPTGV